MKEGIRVVVSLSGRRRGLVIMTDDKIYLQAFKEATDAIKLVKKDVSG